MLQKIEIEINVPDGYEFVRYGVPESGEFYLGENQIDVYLREGFCLSAKYFVVRKIKQKQWRTPVLPADWGKECEFSDEETIWRTHKLACYDREDDSDLYPWRSWGGHSYTYCRIACDE